MPSYLHDGQCHVQTHMYITQLLVMNDAGATTMIISLRLPFLTEPSAPANSSAHRIPPQPRMVARDSSRIFFPTQSIHSTSLTAARWKGSHKELSRLHPEWLHSEQSCFYPKNGKHAAPPTPAPSKLDPSVRVLPSLRGTLTEGALFDYTPSRRTRGSPFFALCTATPRRCSRSFLTSLDPLDPVVANLLDKY
jgi:hypothetical protein